MTCAISVTGLTAEEIARSRAPLDRAYTLPPQAYTCAEIGAVERRQVLKKSWLPIGRVEQVPDNGDYMCVDLLDQPLMIVRGMDGEVRVMSRTCLHRGAPLAEGSGNSRLFVCPYHAWSYGPDGQLKKAPLMDGAADFDPQQCQLPKLRTEIWNGFILVNFDDEADPFTPQVERFAAYFAQHDLADMKVIRTLEFDSQWNWKVLVENFMEAYHHIAIHARTIEPIYRARDSVIIDYGEPASILHMPSAHGEPPAGFPLIQGLNEEQQCDLFAAVAFPFFLFAVQGNAMVWYQILPVSHDRLTLKIHFCVPQSSTQLENFNQLADAAAEMTSVIHHEDISANDKVWTGLNAPLAQQGRLSPLEKSIWQLNQWWLDKMSEGGGQDEVA